MKSKLFIIFLFLILGNSFIFSQTKMNAKKWKKSERDSMERAQFFFDEGYRNLALPIFEKLQAKHSSEDYLKYITALCGLERSDWHSRSLLFFEELSRSNKKIKDIKFELARAYHLNYKFDEALNALNEYESTNKKITILIKKEISILKNYCKNAKELVANSKPSNIKNVGGPINSTSDEYVPIVNADETMMFFTYRGDKSTGGRQNFFNEPDDYGIFYEDVYLSKKENGNWTEPVGIFAINTNENDAAVCLSHDGLTLFIFRDDRISGGDILVSHFSHNEWSSPEKLIGDINSSAWEGSIALSPNEKVVIFSSERAGGFGGKDLYKSTLDENGRWSTAINLGDKINTELDEDAPFFHPDGKTFVFSSKGFNSMGGYDIFRASLLSDSTYSNDGNLGFPINTTCDDIYYVLSLDGKRGYYASGKEGGLGLQDIYIVEPGLEQGFVSDIAILKGTTTKLNVVAETEIEIIITATGKVFNIIKSNDETGKYVITLPKGVEYSINFKMENFQNQKKIISFVSPNGYEEITLDIDFNNNIISPTQSKADTLTAKITSNPVISNPMQKDKIKDISSVIVREGLFFKVQIAAFKLPQNYRFNYLIKLGQVQQFTLEDGITRFTIGDEFNSLEAALAYCNKVKKSGQRDAFVTAIYNGKRTYIRQLRSEGILPPAK